MNELALGFYGIMMSKGLQFLGALAIVVIGYFAAKTLSAIMSKALKKSGLNKILIAFFANVLYYALMTFVIVAALEKIGIPTTSFIAVLATAGLAIGLALKDSLQNFASGVLLIMFRPFKAGDFVEGGGVSGIVEEVQIFNTVLKSPDNKRLIVPNSKMTGDNIVNYSANPTRRIDMVIGCGYGDDLKLARDTIMELIVQDERILKEPEPAVMVMDLGDSSVNFAVRPWVNTADYWAVQCDLKEKIKCAFDEKDLNIPYPQRDVHIIERKAG
ncbi:mechanosensitive ion channel [Candidatus Sumerlaeota bacterium]|nr:mechanosensitive ion channel [Candidatus Sumerlaeota bacterium]